MIIARTPFRISFFGGSTDYPAFFKEHGGAVLGTSINKYCYIMVRDLPPYFENKYRLVYRNEEFIDCVDEIHHPVIKECLKYMGIKEGLEIIHWADLPARKGMGTSSAFTVNLLNALHIYTNKTCCSESLAKLAALIEQKVTYVGCQDHYLTSVGGMNFITFGDSTSVMPVNQGNLNDYLLLFDIGVYHVASKVAERIIQNIPDKIDILTEMKKLAYRAKDLLPNNVLEFGRLLDVSWELKKLTSDSISTPYIDYLYDRGKKAGALGGKLLGAGLGGYLMLFVEPDKQRNVKRAISLKQVKFKFEKEGTQIIYKEK